MQIGTTDIGDNKVLIVNNSLKLTCSQVKNQANAARHTFVEPDVRNRNRKLDVAHALATNAGQSYLHTTAVTNDTLVFDTLVFSAGTLPVTGWSKDALTEEASFFRFECAVVNCFWIQHFTAGPRSNDLRRRNGNGDMIELLWLFVDSEKFTQVIFNAHNDK